MTNDTQTLLASLSDFPAADRAAWRALVERTSRTKRDGDSDNPDERLARCGEDGAQRKPLYCASDLPTKLCAPTTWRTGTLINLARIEADTADDWAAAVKLEIGAGATGIATAFLPEGAEPHAAEFIAGGRTLLLAGFPEDEIDGDWDLMLDPINFAVAAGVEPANASELIDGDLQRMIARVGHGRNGSVHLQHYANAGATPAQELGLMCATLVEYARRVEALGSDAAGFLAGLMLCTDLSTALFVSVAKLRAARVLWSKLLASLGDAGDPAPWIVARTAHRTWSAMDEQTNWIRGSVQATAAFLGGADACVVAPHDRVAADESSPTALRTARDTVSVLGLEGHLERVRDPARGSYLIECETDRLAREAWEFFQSLEARGGLVRALSTGAVAAALGASKQARRDRLASGEAKLVGVNAFRSDGEERVARTVRTRRSWDVARESAPFEGPAFDADEADGEDS